MAHKLKITARDTIGKAVHAVYLNGNVVMNPTEFETGARGYVVFLNDKLPKLLDGSFASEIRRGAVAVEFVDGTIVE